MLEENIPKIILDFFDTQLGKEIDQHINVNGNIIQKIRFGQHNDPLKLRVVLDLAPNKKYEYKETFNGKTYQHLIIIVVKSSEKG